MSGCSLGNYDANDIISFAILLNESNDTCCNIAEACCGAVLTRRGYRNRTFNIFN